jgi:thiol-disulfide isomerase/thioredoxin
MDEMRQKARRRWQLFGLAAVAGALAGVIAVYFMQSGDGNVVAGIDCSPALAAAKRAAPFAKGEVAAFQAATSADALTDLAFKSPNGGDLTLASFAGKTILVNLWATWCVPCRKEMPALDRLQTAVGSDDFQVVAVNIDLNAADKARAFLADIGVARLPFYSDPTMGVFTKLRGRGLALGLPTSLLVDGKGCRIGVVEGPAEWDSDDAKALIQAAEAQGV